MPNAILNPDRTRKNIVAVTEEIARSPECKIDILAEDIFISNAPPIPDELFIPRLLENYQGLLEANPGAEVWEETDPDAAAKLAAIQAEKDASEGKRAGFLYSGTQVPVTNEDAVGALQMAYGFDQMGMQSTNFHMSNGEILHLTLSEWPTFKAAFFAARASFFD